MRYFTILLPLLLFHTATIAQTNIQLIIQNPAQHKINKVDAFDLSQKEFHDYVYGDTIQMHFDKKNIDCYNIRCFEGEKRFWIQPWLDSGNIKIWAHLDEKKLVIDTVINSPIFYKVAAFAKQYFELGKTKDTALLNQFLLNAFEENIGNPFSTAVADYFVRLNQNSKVNLLKLKKLTDLQGDRFSWFLFYQMAVAKMNKILAAIKINANDYLFVNNAAKKVKLTLNGANYYVLDFWFLACTPCRQQHVEIKSSLRKLQRKNVAVISVSTDHDISEWKAYLQKHQYKWQNYLEDVDKSIPRQLSVNNFPLYIILDANGNMVETYNAFSDVLKRFDIKE
ncbi:MAG: TlpA disulfide reductase family protein [Ferruginibacter sp.]|jgi:peroxiredoxin